MTDGQFYGLVGTIAIVGFFQILGIALVVRYSADKLKGAADFAVQQAELHANRIANALAEHRSFVMLALAEAVRIGHAFGVNGIEPPLAPFLAAAANTPAQETSEK